MMISGDRSGCTLDIYPFMGRDFSECYRQRCINLSGLTKLRKSLPSIKQFDLGL